MDFVQSFSQVQLSDCSDYLDLVCMMSNSRICFVYLYFCRVTSSDGKNIRGKFTRKNQVLFSGFPPCKNKCKRPSFGFDFYMMHSFMSSLQSHASRLSCRTASVSQVSCLVMNARSTLKSNASLNDFISLTSRL